MMGHGAVLQQEQCHLQLEGQSWWGWIQLAAEGWVCTGLALLHACDVPHPAISDGSSLEVICGKSNSITTK